MAKLEDLKVLAKGIDRNKVKNIHVIGNRNPPSTILDEFYQALLDNKFETDSEYAQYFYTDHAKNKAYYKLKDRLNERLINTLFFIDINKNDLSQIQKAYYRSYKNFSAIKILIGKNLRKPAISLAKKTIKESLHYGFTIITIEIARILKSNYSTIDINKKQFSFYRKILKNHIKIYKKEIEVEDYTSRLALHHFNKTVIDSNKKKFFKKKYKRLKSIINDYHSYKIITFSYLYFFLYLELSCSWKEVIKESKDFFEYIKNHENLLSGQLEGMVLSRKLVGLFMLKHYKLALDTIEYAKTVFPKGSFNWFFIQDYLIRIQFYTQNFEAAEKIIEEVRSNIYDNLNFKRWIESFRLNEAFIHYLNQIGKLELKNSPPTFRLQKFLNEVPNHSKDKKGSNITILILQILFLLEGQKYDALIDRAESLKVYTQRYLKGDGTYRSNCFIKMLLCLPAANFERNRVEQKAKKYLDRLHAMPIEKAKQSAELEVMPYEMLWGFVLESLDRHKK